MLKDDLSNLNEVLDDFDQRLSGWKEDVSLGGRNIERANMEQPAFVAYYDQIKAEAESLCNKMEMQAKVAKAKSVKTITNQSQKDHGERTVDKMADTDPAYVAKYMAYLEVKERYLKAKSVVDSLQQRGYSLNNIVKIRIAELNDITIYDKL